MESVIFLLRRIVALLTSFVVAIVPSSYSVEPSSYIASDSLIVPYATSSSTFYGLGGSSLYTNTNGSTTFSYRVLKGAGAGVCVSRSIGVGVSVSIPTGFKVTVSFSGFSFGRRTGAMTTINFEPFSGYAWPLSVTSAAPNTASYSVSDYRIADQTGKTLASASGASGTVSFTADHDISLIAFVVTFDQYTVPQYTDSYSFIDVSKASMTVTTADPIDDAILGIYAATSDIANSNRAILAALENIAGTKSAMQQFEEKYLDQMEDQLNQVEDMLSPSNTALPNGGDFAGFASDIQDGLGLDGSSFDADEFSDALSAFGDSNSTGADGPWEFFTQGVADSLAGDTSAAGLADDDYIYQWLEQIKQRFGDTYDSVVS